MKTLFPHTGMVITDAFHHQRGVVRDVVLEPHTFKVRGFVLSQKKKIHSPIVVDPETLEPLQDARGHRLMGVRVITVSGEYRGKVVRVEWDEQSYFVMRLLVKKKDFLFWKKSTSIVTRAHITQVHPLYIVIDDALVKDNDRSYGFVHTVPLSSGSTHFQP